MSRAFDDQYDRVMSAGGDPYAILDVGEDAGDAEVKHKYRQLALLFHPDKAKGGAQRERSEEAFRLIGMACALLLDDKKRREYDNRARDGGRMRAGKDNLGGVKVDQKDPEAFFNNIFAGQGKGEQGAEAFANWMNLAQNGTGESALGAVIHGNPDLAKQDPNDTDDHVAKKLASMGLADHTQSLSIPGAEDAKRHFKSSRARTTHTNRKGETTVQRTGQSHAMIDGGENGNIIVETTYKVVGFVPKAGSGGASGGKLPGGIAHAPADDPRFKQMAIEHDSDMQSRKHARSDKRTYSDPDMQEKYGGHFIEGGDGASMATRRVETRSIAASRMTGKTGRSSSYDDAGTLASYKSGRNDADTLASRRTGRTESRSMASSAAYSRSGDDDGRSMRTTKTSQSSKSAKTSRQDDDDLRSMASGRSSSTSRSRSRDDSGTMRSSRTAGSSGGSTLRTSRSTGNLKRGDGQSRWADAPPMPDSGTMRSAAPSGYSRRPEDSATMMSSRTGKTGYDEKSMISSRTGKTGRTNSYADDETMMSSRTGRTSRTATYDDRSMMSSRTGKTSGTRHQDSATMRTSGTARTGTSRA